MSAFVVMAEWLRRWTRNPMGFSRAGSNPAHDDFYFFSLTFVLTLSFVILSFHTSKEGKVKGYKT